MSNNVRAIRSEADYRAALARIDALMDAEPGTPESEELDVLVDLVELYEEENVPMGYPSALAGIRFRMEQEGFSARDLIPLIGSRSKVSEVLSGKRPLTMQMARALHAGLGIPADVLLQQPGGEIGSALEGIVWERFPLEEMAKRGWIKNRPNLFDHAEEIMRDLIDRTGGEYAVPAVLYRKKRSRPHQCQDRSLCTESGVLGGSGAGQRPATACFIQTGNRQSGFPARCGETELVGGRTPVGSGVFG